MAPFLFLFYFNDFASALPVVIHPYTDDGAFYNEINSLDNRALLNDSFVEFLIWSQKWQEAINFEKSAVMTFTNKNQPSALNVVGVIYFCVMFMNTSIYVLHLRLVPNGVSTLVLSDVVLCKGP